MIPKRALFIQLRRIGDILMCTPAIRAFKKQFPECRLDFLTEIPDVLQGNPYISSIIDVDRSKEFNIAYQYRLIRKIHAAKYDLVIDFLANPRSAYYSFLSRARTRLSYGYGHRRWAYNIVPHKDNELIFAADDKLRLLKSIGVSDGGLGLNFYPSEHNREEARKILTDIPDPIITLSPVSRRVYRRWPLENYATLADRLIAKFNASVVILTGPGEEEAADKIAALSKTRIHDIRVSNLGLLGAIFECSSLHIGNDNGPKHIAVACGAPTLAIFGTDNPISWTYPDPTKHHWIAPPPISERFAGNKRLIESQAINTISIDDVWQEVLNITGVLPNFGTMIKKA
jgi:heptosyltransferase III